MKKRRYDLANQTVNVSFLFSRAIVTTKLLRFRNKVTMKVISEIVTSKM